MLRTYTFLLSLKVFIKLHTRDFNYAYIVRKFWSMTLDTASAQCEGKMQKWIVLARVRHHVGRDESVLEGSLVMNDDEARAGLSHPYHIKRFFCFSPSTSPLSYASFWSSLMTAKTNIIRKFCSLSKATLALYFPLCLINHMSIKFFEASRHDLNWDFKANVICAFWGFQSPFSTHFAL